MTIDCFWSNYSPKAWVSAQRGRRQLRRGVGIGSRFHEESGLGSKELGNDRAQRRASVRFQGRSFAMSAGASPLGQALRDQLSQARGFRPCRCSVAIRENIAAAKWPPHNELAPQSFFRPKAGPRWARSEALLSSGHARRPRIASAHPSESAGC